MNRKGATTEMGVLIALAITLIVGVILFTASAQQVGDAVNTFPIVNQSIDTVVNGTAQFLTTIRALGSVVIFNETNGTTGFTAQAPEIDSGEYTIANNQIDPTAGGLAVSITPDTGATTKSAWQVSGTAQPTTYIDDAGGRAIANVIILLFAVAIAMIAIIPAARSKIADMAK